MNLAQATLKHPRCWGHCSLQPRPPHCCVFALPTPGPTEALLPAASLLALVWSGQRLLEQRGPCRRGALPRAHREGRGCLQGWGGEPFGGRYSGDMGCWQSCHRRAGPGTGAVQLKPGEQAQGQRVQSFVLPLLCRKHPSSGSCRDFPQAPGRSRSEGSAQVLCGPGLPSCRSSSRGRAVPLGAEGPAAACLFTVWPCLGGTRARVHPGAQASAAPRPWATPRWGQVCRRWGCGRGERGGLAGRSWVWRGPQQDGSFTPGPLPW